MGTSEDVAAEKHFIPPTLTEMLLSKDTWLDGPDIDIIKGVFKEWLRTVGLPNRYGISRDAALFNITESTQQLLITLVDEP